MGMKIPDPAPAVIRPGKVCQLQLTLLMDVPSHATSLESPVHENQEKFTLAFLMEPSLRSNGP
jgi:hypothetical protein